MLLQLEATLFIIYYNLFMFLLFNRYSKKFPCQTFFEYTVITLEYIKKQHLTFA